MAAVGDSLLTLADWAKRTDPNGKVPSIAELLAQDNEILMDAVFKEGNLPTGERVTQRTGLPNVYWRLINQGVPPSKSRTAQVDEQAGMLEARSELDVEIANLNGASADFRMSEARPFMEAMNQEMASTMFYGTADSPEEFVGLAPRYSSLSAANGENILSAGGSGSDNTSVWLIGWSTNTVYNIFPKGSKAGIEHEDLGIGDAFDSSNNRFRAYMDHWKWKCGLAVKDWRYACRIANIDVSDLAGLANTQAVNASTFLPKLMSRAIDRLPSLNGVKPVFYANRSVLSLLRVAAMEKSNSAVTIEEGLNQFGETIHTIRFLGIPVRKCDALLNTESVVS